MTGGAIVQEFVARYDIRMTRTTIDIDDQACAEVMRRYRLTTKREAVNLALRKLAETPAITPKVKPDPVVVERALSMSGIGWEGDLDEMRRSRVPGL